MEDAPPFHHKITTALSCACCVAWVERSDTRVPPKPTHRTEQCIYEVIARACGPAFSFPWRPTYFFAATKTKPQTSVEIWGF